MPKPFLDRFRKETEVTQPSKDKPETVVSADQYQGSVDPGGTAGPVKVQVEVQPVSGDIQVVNAKPGEIGLMDRLKAYWHTIITVCGAILVALNELTPVTAQLGGHVQAVVTVLIIVCTAVVNASKSNETWVQKQ
jgi:hypothetical protein